MLRGLRKTSPDLPPAPEARWQPTGDPITQDSISDCRHLLAVVDHRSQIADISALLRAWVMGPVLNPSANWLTFADLTTPEACRATARSWAGPNADWPDSPLPCLHRLIQLRHEALSAGLRLTGRVVVALPLEGELQAARPAIAQARARGIFMAPIILAEDALANENAYRYYEAYAEHLILAPHASAPGMTRNFSGSLRFFRTVSHKNYY